MDSSRNEESDHDQIQHTTQQVGTTIEMPRIYSSSGRFEDSFIGNMDTYGSYSAHGMYGNHASLNYIFGNTGSNHSKKVVKPKHADIRYDSKGIILNYTRSVADMFLLSDKEGFMGENVINLIDPAFVKEKGEMSILHSFGIKSAVESAAPRLSVLTGVRTNGEPFEMTISIRDVHDNEITARFDSPSSTSNVNANANANVNGDIETAGNENGNGNDRIEANRLNSSSSSSFSSYADTFNKSIGRYSAINTPSPSTSFYGAYFSNNGTSTNTNININANPYNSTSSFKGMFVDMTEIGPEDDEWIGTGRYTAGREEIYTGQETTQSSGMSAVSLTAFSDLRRSLENGILLLDGEADSLSEVVNVLLDEAEMKRLATPEVRESLIQLFGKKEESQGFSDISGDKECCKVYVAKLSFLSNPLIGMVRVRHPIVLEEQSSPLMIRYFLFVLGSKECTSTNQLHEMGRAFSLMMSQNWFSNAARKITTPSLFLKLMDNFMTRCTMLPPPDPLSDNPFQLQRVRGVDFRFGQSSSGGMSDESNRGCCGTRTATSNNNNSSSSSQQHQHQQQETVVVFLPNTTLQRTHHQLRKRKRVLNEHENNLKTTALQQEPTLEELEKEKPSPFINHLTTRDRVISGITITGCILVFLLLVCGHFVPHDDGKHAVPMIDYSMSIMGGLKSLTNKEPAYYELPQSPRGLYEIRVAVQTAKTPYHLFYTILEKPIEDSAPEIQHTPLFNITSSGTIETEQLTEVDIANDLMPEGKSVLMVKVTTDSELPVGFVLYAEAMKPIGRYRIVIGAILLVAIYVLLLLEVINRAVVAFIGAFLTLLLISFVSHAPALTTVVGWMDSSTLCLLFGMMIMIQMLSTTGFFEYLAIQMLLLTKGHILRLNIALCTLTAVCSAFLDNVTTMLLIAPVTIELSRMMNVNPIPFLLPEVIYSNLGGTATQIGDPPNIILGNMLKDHLGFMDFIYNATPNVVICCIVVYFFIYWYYKNDLCKPAVQVDESLKEKYQIKNKPLLVKCGSILLTTILLFFLHSVHHIDTAYLAIAGAFACLLLGTNEDLHATFELLEWETLVFFAGLFIMIEGINEMGVIRAIGNAVCNLIMTAPPNWQSFLAHMLILWVSGLASSVLDNIAFTATMVPIIKILGEHPELSQRMSIYSLAWALCFGACFGGNGTLVGAGANLVTAGICATNGYPITFGQFFKFGFSVMMITLVVSTIYILVRYVDF